MYARSRPKWSRASTSRSSRIGVPGGMSAVTSAVASAPKHCTGRLGSTDSGVSIPSRRTTSSSPPGNRTTTVSPSTTFEMVGDVSVACWALVGGEKVQAPLTRTSAMLWEIHTCRSDRTGTRCCERNTSADWRALGRDRERGSSCPSLAKNRLLSETLAQAARSSTAGRDASRTARACAKPFRPT